MFGLESDRLVKNSRTSVSWGASDGGQVGSIGDVVGYFEFRCRIKFGFSKDNYIYF